MSKVFKAIGNAVSGVVKAVVNVVSSVVKAVVNVVSSVINFIAQPFMGLLGGMGDMPNAASEAERQQGVLIQRAGSVVNIPVIYGYRKVGGTVTFAETGSTDNKYLWVAYVFSEGPVEGLREVFIDDFQMPADIVGLLNSGQPVNITSGKYANRVLLQFFHGTYFDDPKKSTIGDVTFMKNAPSWKNSMVYNGMSVLFARFEWKKVETQADADSNPFSGNIPEVQVSMLGRKVASLVTENPQQYAYSTAPVRYSTNPAEILLDYLRNPRYGKGLGNIDIDWDTWVKAANKCNQVVTYVNGVKGPILTSNFVLDTATSILSNVKTLLMGFRAYMPYIQGKYKLKIEDAGNDIDILSGSAIVAASFTKDDMVGSITYTGIEKSAKYNQVVVTYVDPDQKWSNQQVTFPETEEARQFWINQDGGRENKLDATFPTITNYAIAKDLAKMLFNKSRYQQTISLTVTGRALELEPGDNIEIIGNILDFQGAVWRIVSFKLNEDLSVELACVLNQDNIYPHTRVGEQDVILPTYVPKGSTIYFPVVTGEPPVGLVPPTKAYLPPGVLPIDTTLHPLPSTPESPTSGGGVGAYDSPINQEPVNTFPPPPSTSPTVLTDVVTFANAKVRDNNNGTVNFNFEFTRPTNAAYAYTRMWYRSNTRDNFARFDITEQPAAGQVSLVNVGPVVKGNYEFYTRVFYVDGTISTVVGKFVVDARVTGSTTVTAQQVGNISSTGWSLPGLDTTPTPRYDSRFSILTVSTVLDSGLPFATKKLNVTVQQDTLATPSNFSVKGVRIFYKPISQSYFDKVDYMFPADYVPGQIMNFEFPGDVGERLYPSIPTKLQQNYDFVFRWIYKDDVMAQYQVVALDCYTEYNQYLATPYNFNVIKLGENNVPLGADQGVGKYIVDTIEQAPPGSVVDPRNLLPSVVEIANGSVLVSPRARFLFNIPDNANINAWRGYVIRYRQVLPGSTPPFEEVSTGIGYDAVSRRIWVEIPGWEYGREYEIVLTARVRYSGATINATNSLVGRGKVSLLGQIITNWYNSFNFQEKTTVEALRQIISAFPAIPVINIGSWKKISVVAPSDQLLANLDLQATSATAPLLVNTYYELKFQAPATGFQALRVYRRQVNLRNINKTFVTDRTCPYFGVGPWEMARLTIPFGSPDANGFYTVNLRAPIDASYFNPNFETTNPENTQLLNRFNKTGHVDGGTQYYPLAPTFKPSTTQEAWETQYFFVLERTGGSTTAVNTTTDISPNGKLLTGFISYAATTDGFSRGGVVERELEVSEFINKFASKYQRNLEQAITGLTSTNLYKANATFPSTFRTTMWPLVWPTAPSTRIQSPTGVTIR
jgi:Putative phage tail protein